MYIFSRIYRYFLNLNLIYIYSVIDDDPNFSKSDYEMIQIMDYEKYIHSIMLLNCKHRIMNANEDWLQSFYASGGISVLVENMDNRLEKQPVSEIDAAALSQILFCLKHFMKDALDVVVDTRGAIDAFVLSLRFEYKQLSLQVLELLSVICYSGNDTARWSVVQGFEHLAITR
jgi:hypothetical protein